LSFNTVPSYDTVTVGSSATKIVGANPQRISLIIVNTGTPTVFIGQDNSVTTSNGIPLKTDMNLTEDSGGQKVYCGDIWGICASSSDVRWWERAR
jgi:hypothetical protein